MNKQILVTGANGFMGRNLRTHLDASGYDSIALERTATPQQAQALISHADVIVHLAGVNRPDVDEEFEAGNVDYTQQLCDLIAAARSPKKVIFASSIQAEKSNPYGKSKKSAEDVLRKHSDQHGTAVTTFRLKNVFGKWCRPNYNSVIATFCHNLARELPIDIRDPDYSVDLVYIDDVVAAFANAIETKHAGYHQQHDDMPSNAITLGSVADLIRSFRDIQNSQRVPDFSSAFNRKLYATYLSYLTSPQWIYDLDLKADARGSLVEFVKSPAFGQVFLSRTKPGITRGNHYHHTKTEKFFVVSGEAMIRFRHIDKPAEILEFPVSGNDHRVVDIPPGYTHSITNVGSSEMVTLFWASEEFDPNRPDTYALPVDPPASVSIS